VPALHTLQMLGAVGAASYIIARAGRASRRIAYYRYAIIAQPRARLPEIPKGYRVEEMTPEALAGHIIDIGPDIQRLRFTQGLIPLAAFDRKDTLVGIVWLRQERYDEDEVRVRFILPEHCCWDTGLWINPRYRLSRAFAALWGGVGEWMDGRALTHSLSRISDYNMPALASHKRMGAITLSHHVFIVIGAWQWCFGVRPRLSRIGQTHVPELDLHDKGIL
jgi:hypothetical protein